MIYLLSRKDVAHYDETRKMVVRAISETQAREIANQNASNEGPIWTDPKQASCERVTEKGFAKMICVDVREG